LPHEEISQNKSGLNYRYILIIGLRLIGIYLLIFGFFGFLNKLSSAVIVFHLASTETGVEVFPLFFHNIEILSIASGVIWSLIRILIGLYFCKGGNMVIRFLAGKDEFLAE